MEWIIQGVPFAAFAASGEVLKALEEDVEYFPVKASKYFVQIFKNHSKRFVLGISSEQFLPFFGQSGVGCGDTENLHTEIIRNPLKMP